MKKVITTILGCMFGVLLIVPNSNAITLWGVTNGTNDQGWWSGGEIFTVDTETGSVDIKASYSANDGVLAFGDIALAPNGDIYVTYHGQDGFDKLARVDPFTWEFDWIQDLGGSNDQVNALTFMGNTLYGVTGGGIPADLLKFTLTDSGATATNLGNIGTNSDGDIAVDSKGNMYYTSWETGSTSELNIIDFETPPSKTGKEISTLSGWAGLCFDPDDILWAGNYWDQNLYTLNYNTTDPAYTATKVWDLSGKLGGAITGLDRPIPEPSTVLLLGSGLIGILTLGRKKLLKK